MTSRTGEIGSGVPKGLKEREREMFQSKMRSPRVGRKEGGREGRITQRLMA